MEDRAQFRAVVRGRVQGVGFRAHTLRAAVTESLSGFTRNLEDGTVLVVAEGPRAALERFLVWLRHGPPSARVAGVQIEWEDRAPVPSIFEIRE